MASGLYEQFRGSAKGLEFEESRNKGQAGCNSLATSWMCEASSCKWWSDTRRKSFHWAVIIVFFAVLAFQLERHFRSPRSTGLLLEVGSSVPPENCEFNIPLVLHISADRALRLNLEPVPKNRLTERLSLILRERHRPVLYVQVDTEITVQELAEILEAARQSDNNVSFRLVTPGNRKYSCIDYQREPAA
jgi:biopolymer transport protein ExbD